MKIEIIYPIIKKQSLKNRLRRFCGLCFIFAGLSCSIINYSTGGNAWSVIVIWSMFLVWKQFISPDLVDYNRISQAIRFIVNSCVLLMLIDLFLAPGFAGIVIPIVEFSALILVCILFFTNFEKQKQNMMPLIFFSVVCLGESIIGLITWRDNNWPFVVLIMISFTSLISCAVRLGKQFIIVCKKIFCVK